MEYLGLEPGSFVHVRDSQSSAHPASEQRVDSECCVKALVSF